ncbi:hypothetical protein AGLY_018335 [Aphis glycines]|uniref:Uncharacterized protein n=1 Tax=Aphis glycines TaxID=307491 RepID=A0A6G0SSN0_APHGL|nr:hypothetical protein AGLY_018335 [Aphis glycines]
MMQVLPRTIVVAKDAKSGLIAKVYGLNGEIGNYLSYIFGLSPEEVGDFFSFELSEIQPVDSKVVDFADYLVNNYISEESLFPPSIWAEKSSSLQRTTNACESFHKKLNNVLMIMQTDSVMLIRSSLISVRQYRKPRQNNILFVENQIKKLNENKITSYLKTPDLNTRIASCIFWDAICVYLFYRTQFRYFIFIISISFTSHELKH